MAKITEMLVGLAHEKIIREKGNLQYAPTADEINKKIEFLMESVPESAARDFVRGMPEEQEYFVKWARRFPDETDERRYGVLVMGADACEDNMIYASCPRELHLTHIRLLMLFPERLLRHTIGDFKKFLRWLEGVEGKKPIVSRY